MTSVEKSTAVLPEQLTLTGAAQTLQRLLDGQRQQSAREVVLDAQSLQVFDTSAVAVLLALRSALIEQGKTLRVSAMPERLQALVTLYGVDELLHA